MRKLGWKKTLAAAAGGLALLVGGGAALAAGGDGSSSSFFESLARHLGISTQELEDATKAAAAEQVDALLEEGKITEEQAEEMKSRIESGEGPGFFGRGGFGGPHHGFGFRGGPGHALGPGGDLSAASEYLGLTEAELRERLNGGESLADVAEAEGKSVDDLKQALLDAAKARLDEAVANERITQEQADAMLERLEGHVDALVEGQLRLHFRHGFRGDRGFDGEPPAEQDAEPAPEGAAVT